MAGPRVDDIYDQVKAMAVSGPYMDFFLHAFKYRELVLGKEVDIDAVNEVEGEIISAFLSLTLKLALDDFKPLFYRVFNLTFDLGGQDVCALITVFHVPLEVAKKLKSLLEFICETLFAKATTVLNNFAEDDFAKVRSIDDEAMALRLLVYVFKALTTVTEYNKMENLLTKNYEDHVNALLAFFELRFEDEDDLDTMLGGLTETLGQLALSTEDDNHWKYLNYQVLLNLRSTSPKVRESERKQVNNRIYFFFSRSVRQS